MLLVFHNTLKSILRLSGSRGVAYDVGLRGLLLSHTAVAASLLTSLPTTFHPPSTKTAAL